MNKKYLIPMAAVAVIGATVYGVSQASAASADAWPRDTIVQKLADKFKLDKGQVQAVFDENRRERHAAMETKYQDRLTQAVADGKLTADQKIKVLAEHNKLRDKAEVAMAKTGDERRTAMTAVIDEGKAWAQANNIDAKWLVPGGFGRGGHGPDHLMRGGDELRGSSQQ